LNASEDKSKMVAHQKKPLTNWIDAENLPKDYPDERMATMCDKCHAKTD
jgi:hypothetical protein